MISKKDSAPKKSKAYFYGQDVFYYQFNDINFYVEDARQENFYFVILRKLFPEARFEKIFPLCGKQNVIDEARRNTTNRKSVYIVDKDFDDLLKIKKQLPNLFYLKAYCIENYLLEEESIIAFVIEEKPRLKDKEVKKGVALTKHLEDCCSQLLPIFVLFFLVQKYGLGERNVGLPIERLLKNNNKAAIDQMKVNAYLETLKKKARERHCR